MDRMKLDADALKVETYETDAAAPRDAVPTTTWLSRVTACPLC